MRKEFSGKTVTYLAADWQDLCPAFLLVQPSDHDPTSVFSYRTPLPQNELLNGPPGAPPLAYEIGAKL